MKVSLNWIKQFIDVPVDVDTLVQKIGQQLGAVESVVSLADTYRHCYVIKVVAVEKHPNADKLSVCLIDDGGAVMDADRNPEGFVQVVCGAPNVKADMLAAWLPPGATVPATADSEPLVLEAHPIRGTVSNGMLASAQELSFGDDHSGIVVVDVAVEPGTPLIDAYALGDTIIEIENKMFTHRPDCFGVLGVAREVAGILHTPFTSPPWYQQPASIETSKSEPHPLQVQNTIPELVPRFMAVALDEIHIGSSPLMTRSYLSRLGVRPVNNVVDVTNYMMLLTGQPLHAYDADKLLELTGKDTLQLETRLSKAGDELTLIDGKHVKWTDDKTVLITSHDIPVGIGGVMGGQSTEVDETTKRIVLECANFDMYAIRRASMQHGLFTEAVTRFNKGQSAHQTDRVLAEAVSMLQYTAHASVASQMVDEGQKLEAPQAVELTADFISSRLGMQLKSDEITEVLTAVEFHIDSQESSLHVTPPFWRTDIAIAEDIVEEVGRLIGFDRLPLELPQRSLMPVSKNNNLNWKQLVREQLKAAGANEVATYSFVHGDLLRKTQQNPAEAFELSNALSPDLQYYRLSLLPSLLSNVHQNIKAGHHEFALFELGVAHHKKAMDPDEPTVPFEAQRLSFVYAVEDKHWEQHRFGPAYYQARHYLDMLAYQLGLDISIAPLAEQSSRLTAAQKQLQAPFDPERSGVVKCGKAQVGIIGEFLPAVRGQFKLPTACAGFELDAAALSDAATHKTYRRLSRFPKITQDISLSVSNDFTFAEVAQVVQAELEKTQVETALEPLDIYQAKPGDRTRHITFRVTAWSHEGTMQTKELSEILDAVALAAKRSCKAQRL